MHRRQTQNLTPLHLLQLRSHNTIQPRTNWVSGLAYQNAGIIIELDDGAIWALQLLLCADHDSVADVTAAHFVGGRG